MELTSTNYWQSQSYPHSQDLQTIWSIAEKRVMYYLQLNHVPDEQRSSTLNQILEKANQEWLDIHDEDVLIKLFIEEAQQLLHPETSRLCHLNTDRPETSRYMGYLRSTTGPHIHRSSIKPAVLEKIPVKKVLTSHFIRRYKAAS
jgi:Mg/Co/Ni transporter MgtE